MKLPLSIQIVEEEQEQLMSFDAPPPIFIARDQQMKSFGSYLSSWCENMNLPSKTVLSEVDSVLPAPLRGLFVFIYGHDGMGKSTLLDQYWNVSSKRKDVNISRVISWQDFQMPTTFNLPGIAHSLHAREFFAVVAEKIASALNIAKDELREYQQTCLALHNFRDHLYRVPSELLQEKQYRMLHIASSTQLLISPDSEVIKRRNRDQMSDHIEAFLEKDSPIPSLWQQEITYILSREALEDVLHQADLKGQKRALIWNPETLLGEALGRDLSMHASDHPLLFFFDSYEVSYEADAYLRLVMQAAGDHVGWVIASRNNLWSSGEYGYNREDARYQKLMMLGRGLFIDLQSPESGFFSVSDIELYFRKLCAQYPLLPVLGPELLIHIGLITRGIPLGVSIMAQLYQKDPEILLTLSPVKTPSEVIDMLMQHYLAHPEQKERRQLCALALLRRAEHAQTFLTSVGLLEQQSNLAEVKAHLSKHADFVVGTYETTLSLHTVVRHIIRQWVLKHRRDEADIHSLLHRLKEFYHEMLQTIEQKGTTTTIVALFSDSQWIETSLDLIEMVLWINEEPAIKNALRFLIAAAIYNPQAVQKLLEIVSFFEPYLPEQAFENWQDALLALSFAPNSKSFPDPQKVRRLSAMVDDLKQASQDDALLLSGRREELIALLFWKAGNSASSYSENLAQEYYLQAWKILNGDQLLQNRLMQFYLQRAYNFFDRKQYAQCMALLEQACDIQYNNADVYYTLGNTYYAQSLYRRAITCYQYAIVIEHRHIYAYMNLANTHYMCKEYQRALDEYNRVEELASAHLPPAFHYNRANAYLALERFNEAKEDYDRAIQLEPQLAWAYGNRAHTRAMLWEYRAALIDYKLAADLAPKDCNVVWNATWAGFTSQHLQKEEFDKLRQIVALDTTHYIADLCRALIEGIEHKNWPKALEHTEKALVLAPEEGETHFWKGIIAAYLGKTPLAKEEIEKALHLGLPPLFLTPLYWLQDEKPKFFTKHALPLLQKYLR